MTPEEILKKRGIWFGMQQDNLLEDVVAAMEEYKNQECQMYLDECDELQLEIRNLKNPMGPRGKAL